MELPLPDMKAGISIRRISDNAKEEVFPYLFSIFVRTILCPGKIWVYQSLMSKMTGFPMFDSDYLMVTAMKNIKG